MELILISRSQGRTWRLQFEPRNKLFWAGISLAMILAGSALILAGYLLRPSSGLLPDSLVAQWQTELKQQRSELAAARAAATEDERGTARRIAMINAQIMRLDAAGNRMTQIANIDSNEFNFNQDPALGGPQTADAGASGLQSSVDRTLNDLQARLDEREREMRVLEDILVAGHLQKEIKPSGWPIASGYITSEYGARIDPFTGSQSFHPGIDFSAPEGSPVRAVAAGIVTVAGSHDGYEGYGDVVEINHGNGYVTRYGHNEKVLVKPGERVAKGQIIARIGSTGRSTGPHVHFEVLVDGSTVNPERYLEAAR